MNIEKLIYKNGYIMFDPSPAQKNPNQKLESPSFHLPAEEDQDMVWYDHLGLRFPLAELVQGPQSQDSL